MKILKQVSVKGHFLLAIALFIFMLGFFTNFVFVRRASQDFYDNAQAFNQTLFYLALLNIVISGIVIAAEIHKKNSYSKVGFVIIFTSILVLAISSIVILTRTLDLANQFKNLGDAGYASIEVFDPKFSRNPKVFAYGVTLSIGLILVMISSITNVVLTFVKGGRA